VCCAQPIEPARAVVAIPIMTKRVWKSDDLSKITRLTISLSVSSAKGGIRRALLEFESTSRAPEDVRSLDRGPGDHVFLQDMRFIFV
jgi:hypothetical protein